MNLQPIRVDFFFRAEQPRHNRKVVDSTASYSYNFCGLCHISPAKKNRDELQTPER
jgi:hypothetical protein